MTRLLHPGARGRRSKVAVLSALCSVTVDGTYPVNQNPGYLLYIGDSTTQFYRDSTGIPVSHYKDPDESINIIPRHPITF